MSNTWWKDPAELIPEQAKLLDTPLEQSLLIKGPPGCGKTNLLLLRANTLYIGEMPNIHIVVFGSLLKFFIQQGSEQYKFPTEKVTTHNRLFTQILAECDVVLDTSKLTFAEGRTARAEAVEKLIRDKKVGCVFDALLLDEAQDYSPAEIKIFRALTKILVAVADDRQKIYEVEDSAETLKDNVDKVYDIKYHFRNGREICLLADGIMAGKPNHVPLIQYSRYDEAEYPSKVTPNSGMTVAEQAEAIAAQVARQRLAYPNDLIAILCPRNEELDEIERILKAGALGSEVTRCGSLEFDSKCAVWIATMAAAKGLEFRAVHIAGLDHLSSMRGAQRRLIFTAVTRAKTAISTYHEKKIPGYLESALRPFESEKKPINMSRIFGKE